MTDPSSNNQELIKENYLLKQRIQDLEKVEDALRESEKKYRAILEDMEDTYCELDLAGNITFINPIVCKITGYSHDEMLGMNFRKFSSPNDKKLLMQYYSDVYLTGIPGKPIIWHMVKKNGEIVPNEQIVSLIRDKDGNATGFRGLGRDLTERIKSEAELRKAEEKYRAILEEMEDTYCETDLKGFVTFMNPAFCRMLGYSLEELIGMHYSNFSAPDDLDKIKQYYFEIFQTGIPGKPLNCTLVKKSGEEAYLEIRTSLIYDEKGKPVGFRGSGRDTTDRMKAENALRESEENYRSILEEMEDCFLETDFLGRFIAINQSVLKVTGYQSDDLIGKSFKKFCTPEDIERIFQHYGEIYMTGIPGKPFQWSVRKKNGEYTLFESVVSLKRDKKGNPLSFRGIGRDISERKKAEDDLRKAEEKYRSIFDNAIEGIFQASIHEDRFLSANSAMARILGYDSPEDLIASVTNIRKQIYVHQEDRKKLIRRLMNGEKITGFESEAHRRDGSTFFCSLSIRIVCDNEGNYLYFEGSLIDISERIQKEKAEREREVAESATRSKSEFLATMSHEIRTPMNAILGMSELLAETDLTVEQRDYVQTFRASGELLISVINDILDFSKIEAGRIDLESIPFDLFDQAENVGKIMALRAHGKGLELICRVDPDIHSCRIGDPTRLRQVLLNLLGNAIKFTHQGEVVLEIKNTPERPDSDMLLFCVRDTGIGITAEQQKTIFDSFSQADSSTTREYGGTGLGLAITKRLIELMGGSIWMKSGVGKGTTFFFTAKLSKADPVHEAATTLPTDLIGIRVLVVDDNATNRLIFNDYLMRWGASVDEAKDGREALEALIRKDQAGASYHLLLLDVNMPGMDGFQVARQMKEIPLTHNPATIVLTSSSIMENRGMIQELGLAGYLSKPVKRTDLFEKILIALGKATETAVSQEKVTAMGHLSPLRILYAEDIETNQKVLRAYLKNSPVEVDVAENGRIAFKKYVSGSYDLVLMDMEMPVMDGLDATKAIRKWEQENNIPQRPIIVLTAHAFSEHRQKCEEAGCTDFLPKPFKKKELLDALVKYSRPSPFDAMPELQGKSGEAVCLQSSISPVEEQPDCPFDMKKILAEFGDDQEFLSEVIDGFTQKVGEQIETIREALFCGDAETVRKEAHAIKGGAGNLTAVDLAKVAAQLELIGKSKELNGACEMVNRLECEYEALRLYAQELFPKTT